jgi:hypothetical protein
MAAIIKRLLISESRSDSNRCTPYRENPTNMTRTLTTSIHVRPAYASCRRSPYVATFRKPPTALYGPYCSQEKGLPTQPTTWLSDPQVRHQFLSQHSYWSSNESQTYADNRLLGLSGPYHWHAIGTFNTYSRVPTHRSLTDTGGGYPIENLRIVIALSPPFPFEGSIDLPNGPAWSQII